jgi:hypothetical protein
LKTDIKEPLIHEKYYIEEYCESMKAALNERIQNESSDSKETQLS